jgi:hypothetical protein
MERQQVAEGRSSAVLSVGYDKETQTLEIELASKAVYQYLKVPETLYDEFIHAPSLGQFMGSRIRGAFEYKRMHTNHCSEAEDHADCTCWCHRITKTSHDPKEGDSEKEKSKKASKKPKKIS